MCCLTYVYFKSYFNKYFSRFLSIFQKVSRIPVTGTVTVSVTVTMSFEVHRSSGGVSTYIETTIRRLSEKVNVQFFSFQVVNF